MAVTCLLTLKSNYMHPYTAYVVLSQFSMGIVATTPNGHRPVTATVLPLLLLMQRKSFLADPSFGIKWCNVDDPDVPAEEKQGFARDVARIANREYI